MSHQLKVKCVIVFVFFAGRKVQKLQNERNSAGRAFAGLRDDRRKLNFRVKSHVFVSLDEIRRGGAPCTDRRRLPGVATAANGGADGRSPYLVGGGGPAGGPGGLQSHATDYSLNSYEEDMSDEEEIDCDS